MDAALAAPVRVLGCSAGLRPAPAEATATATAEAKAGFLWVGGVGPVAGDAVNPSMGAWPRHPCRGHPCHRTHPAFDRPPRSAGPALGVGSVFRRKTDPTPFCLSISDRFHPRMAWMAHRGRETVEGGAVSDCGVSAAWARGMPRAGWAGRPTPVLPCAQESAHEQAAAKPTGTYLRRPRNPTPPRQTTDHPRAGCCCCCCQGCRPAAGTTAGAGCNPAEPPPG